MASSRVRAIISALVVRPSLSKSRLIEPANFIEIPYFVVPPLSSGSSDIRLPPSCIMIFSTNVSNVFLALPVFFAGFFYISYVYVQGG